MLGLRSQLDILVETLSKLLRTRIWVTLDAHAEHVRLAGSPQSVLSLQMVF